MAAWPATVTDCHTVLFVKKGSELVPYQRPARYPLSQERHRLLKNNAYSQENRSSWKKPAGWCLEPSHIEPWLDHEATLYDLPKPGYIPRQPTMNTSNVSVAFPEDLDSTFHSGLLDTTFNVTEAGPQGSDQGGVPDLRVAEGVVPDLRVDQGGVPGLRVAEGVVPDLRVDQGVVPDLRGNQGITRGQYSDQNNSLYTNGDLSNIKNARGESKVSRRRHHQSMEAPTQRDLPLLFYPRAKPPTKQTIKVPKFSKRSRHK